MSADLVAERLRLFLLSISAFLCIGTIVELWLAGHTEEPLQFVPFVLCGLAFFAIVTVLVRPRTVTIWATRLVMGALILGSLIGVWQHLQGNVAFVLEIKPNSVLSDAMLEALSGAAPLLAPGILALTGVLALAATYYHPALRERPPTL